MCIHIADSVQQKLIQHHKAILLSKFNKKKKIVTICLAALYNYVVSLTLLIQVFWCHYSFSYWFNIFKFFQF